MFVRLLVRQARELFDVSGAAERRSGVTLKRRRQSSIFASSLAMGLLVASPQTVPKPSAATHSRGSLA